MRNVHMSLSIFMHVCIQGSVTLFFFHVPGSHAQIFRSHKRVNTEEVINSPLQNVCKVQDLRFTPMQGRFCVHRCDNVWQPARLSFHDDVVPFLHTGSGHMCATLRGQC